MRKFLLLAVTMTTALASHPQESGVKPEIAQCHADASAWEGHRFDSGWLYDLPFTELARRRDEMDQCFRAEPPLNETITEKTPQGVIDSKVLWQDRYQKLEDWFEMRMTERMVNYLYRHHQWDKFVTEDRAGERHPF